MSNESNKQNIQSLNRINSEFRQALQHFISSAEQAGPLGAQVDKIKTSLKNNDIMFTFAALVEQYAKMKKNLAAIDQQAKQRHYSEFKKRIKKTATQNLAPEQQDKINALLAKITAQESDEVIMLELANILDYFAKITQPNSTSSPHLSTVATDKNYLSESLATAVNFAGRRLVRDVDNILAKLTTLYPNDIILNNIYQQLQKTYSLEDKSIFIDLIAQLSCYLASLVEKERDHAIEVLNDIHANIIAVLKQAKVIEKLMHSGKNNIDDMNKTMLTELENMELKAQGINNIDDMQIHIKKSIALMSKVITNCATIQNKINHANESTIKDLTFKIDSVSSFVEDLENKLNVAEENNLIDDLTQIGNRRGYIEFINKQRDNWLTTKQPLSLLVIDVDHFKSVNDTYGHSTGDQVLKSLAQTLKKQLRSNDYIARYGGEEFVVVLPATTLEQTITLTKKIRTVVNSLKFELRKKSTVLRITCSYGIASFSKAMNNTLDVFNAADNALYQAKKSGRDAIAVKNDNKYTLIDIPDDILL
jgi:diguanylate cyclase (GGDEF)-like protein